MLEGMANHQRRAISERRARSVALRARLSPGRILNAIGYLIRRLDENTGPQNFLRHAYRLQPDSPEFDSWQPTFATSLEMTVYRSTIAATHAAIVDRDAGAARWSARNGRSLSMNPIPTGRVPHNSNWAQRVLDRGAAM